MKPLAITLTLLLLLSSVRAASASQAGRYDVPFTYAAESEREPIPEFVQAEAVRQTLRLMFGKQGRQGRVYLVGDGLRAAWLPALPSVEFVIVSWSERAQLRCRGGGNYWFFNSLTRTNEGYRVGFSCASGDEAVGNLFRLFWQDARLTLMATSISLVTRLDRTSAECA